MVSILDEQEAAEQEAALYLGMMQLYEALGQMIDRKAHPVEKELIKQEPKEELKCDSCGCLDSKRDVEVSKWAQKGKPMEMLCFLCEKEAEHSFYAAEPKEVSDEGSI